MRLRSFLRQDPDIILVGEMRDRETANIAIQAALTGHLVLSTLHTNDAPSAITRLLDMGVEDYLITSTVHRHPGPAAGADALRALQDPLRSRTPQVRDELATSPAAEPVTLWRATGCESCLGTGYRGRTGIHELLLVDEEHAPPDHAPRGCVRVIPRRPAATAW